MAIGARPRFSVLTPIRDPDPARLRNCIESVRAQTFASWEHVIVDDGSIAAGVAPTLADAAAADPRVHLLRGPHRGAAAARRDALAASAGELITVLSADDILEPDALAAIDAVFAAGDVEIAYSDHDAIDADGIVTPSFKPAFSPERLRAHNYIDRPVVTRREVAEAAGGFRDGFDGAEDYDFVLRLTEHARHVAHLPRILCHRRAVRDATAATGDGVAADVGALAAVADHCARVGIDALVEPTRNAGCHRVVRRLAGHPLVTVIIPTRGSCGRVWGTTRCYVYEAVRSLVERSTYRELEFVIVHDADTPSPVLESLAAMPDAAMTLVPYESTFNFSAKVDLGVDHASGSHLLLLNDDTELIEPASVDVLVGHLQMRGVAMAGARLLFADGTLQHGGHVYFGQPNHACLGWRGDSPGPLPLRPLAVERECSGVTAACALVDRAAYEEVGGFPTALPLSYNDIDFSLKLRRAGHRIIWTPWAVWYHFESRTRVSRVLAEEQEWLDARWHAELMSDPYYNPNLVPRRHDFLELPPNRRPGGN
jgi:glycosyltransferase involved in cell wall biosynthesis